MALCHSLLVDAGDGFLKESGTGNGGWCPGGVATRAGMGKGSGCGRGGRRDVKDSGRGESEKMVGPFLC